MKEKIDLLVNSLLDLPKEIMDLQLSALKANDEIQNLSDEILIRENEIKSEINAAVDDAGQKMYSNEESRKIAFLNDSKEDSTLSNLYATKKNADVTLQTIRVEIEMKSNVQRNIRSILGVLNNVEN
jgi:electron transfer flavoprotein alpha subunit